MSRLAIDDLDPRPEPDRLASWRRFISLDLDPADPYHRRWITAGADEPMSDEDARRAVEQAVAAHVWELDTDQDTEDDQEDADR